MDRSNLLERLRANAHEFVDEFLPPGAGTELACLIGDRRHEVDARAFLMFVSVRALLRDSGMPSSESDCEAGQIMAQLHRRAG